MNWLRQWLCRHDWQLKNVERVGVTLGWGGGPEVSMTLTERCLKCGKVKIDKGMYVPGLGKRDETGWPVNDDGTRMRIANDLEIER